MKYVLHWPSGAGGDFILGVMLIASKNLPDDGVVSMYTGGNRWNVCTSNSESMHQGGIDTFESLISRDDITYVRTHRLSKIIEKIPAIKEKIYDSVTFKNINIYCADASELYYVVNLLVTKTIINPDNIKNKTKNQQLNSREFFTNTALSENFMGKESDPVMNFRYRDLFLDVDKVQIENLLLAFDIDYSSSMLKSIREAFSKYAILNQILFILDQKSPHVDELLKRGKKINCKTIQDIIDALDESIKLMDSLGISFNKTHILS